ncbi:MAG: hypothetical protein IPP74_00365 [Alphaproteobacteria bacterium]|nr:hypothetical protein [Alphaproteobacteria bacterium]
MGPICVTHNGDDYYGQADFGSRSGTITLWDAGASDTIDASWFFTPTVIDLREDASYDIGIKMTRMQGGGRLRVVLAVSLGPSSAKISPGVTCS